MREIVEIINKRAMDFINVQLVAENIELFTHLLPEEFRLRKISMPFIFTNFADWKKKCCQKYGWKQTSLAETAK